MIKGEGGSVSDGAAFDTGHDTPDILGYCVADRDASRTYTGFLLSEDGCSYDRAARNCGDEVEHEAAVNE